MLKDIESKGNRSGGNSVEPVRPRDKTELAGGNGQNRSSPYMFRSLCEELSFEALREAGRPSFG
jgi:hypothetical protein